MNVWGQTFLYNIEKYCRAYFEAPSCQDESYVLLASFPKSGNTWLRFIVANVNALMSEMEPASFHSIEQLAPAIRNNRRLIGAHKLEGAPTFLKTHFPFTPFFNKYKSVVIIRDPFKAVPSYYHYLCNARNKVLPEFEQTMFNWRYGFNAWTNFHMSWDQPNVLMFKYEDLQKDTLGCLKNMYCRLGYSINDDIFSRAVDLSSRDNMKRILVERGDPHNKNNFQFVRDKNANQGLTEQLKSKILADKRLSRNFIFLLEKYAYI